MSYNSLYKLFVMNDNSYFNKIFESRFNSESSYKFPLFINGNQAFFYFSSEIANLALKIREYDKRINDAFNNLPNIAKKQYIKKSLIDEIEFTNQIEGVISTRKDINDILDNIANVNKNRLQGIVNKYKLLLNRNNLKIEESQDIRNIYDEMLKYEIELDDKNNLPDGEIFRKNSVHVFRGQEKSIHEGINPESKIIQYIDKSINILNNEDLDILVRVAIFHYLFGYIHPFYDGNGRINRFISSYYLSKNLTPIISYRLSMNIKENLTQYLDAFSHTNDSRNKGDISTFVYEFLDIILKAYQKTEIYALNKNKEIHTYSNIIENLALSKTEQRILFVLIQDELFSGFGLSCSNLSSILEISYCTCFKHLSVLEKANFIKKAYNGKQIFYSVIIDNIK